MGRQVRYDESPRGEEYQMMTTYSDKLVSGEHSTVTVLYKNVDIEMLNELGNFVGRDRASAFPYSGRIFSPYTDNDPCGLRRYRSERPASVEWR